MTAVITEAQRFEMHTCLRGLMGEEVANTMMEHLPPSGWSDVARQSDIALVRSDIASVRSDLDRVEAALKSDIEHVQKDIARVEADLKSGTASLREEIENVRNSIWSSLGITAAIMLGQMALIIYKIP